MSAHRVSHELRSPLSAIRQFVTILSDKLPGELNLEQEQYLGIVLRNVKQLQAMISDLFEVTGVQAGKLRIDVQCASVSDAIEYTVNTLQEAATAKRITLSSFVVDSLPSVCADPARIRQILIILVDNAIKFTPAGGRVNIQARIFEVDSSFLVLEVSDSGCGISPDMAERVFDRLFQVSGPASAGRNGLGLGLYICKDLVTRQGGQIWAKSALGQGAVFSLTLPIFSLPKLIAPAWTQEKRTNTPLTLVVAEIGSQTGCLSEEARAEQFPWVRELLQRCLHSDQDVPLPRMGSAVDLFFIVAITDGIGADAISKRIREQFDGSQHLKQAGLTLSTSYRSLGAIRRNASEPVEDFLEEVGAKLQEHMDEEKSSRMVKNG